MLTARGTKRPIQNTGHADLVDTPDGGSALVLLGVRPLGLTRAFSPLGRETFHTPVDWVDGWPLPPTRGAESSGQVKDVVVFDFADADALDEPGWLGRPAAPHRRRLAHRHAGTAHDGRRRIDASIRRDQHSSGDGSATSAPASRPPSTPPTAPGAWPPGTPRTSTSRSRLAGSWQHRRHRTGGRGRTRPVVGADAPDSDVELRIEMTPPPTGFQLRCARGRPDPAGRGRRRRGGPARRARRPLLDRRDGGVVHRPRARPLRRRRHGHLLELRYEGTDAVPTA